jgi:Holliday junction resolvase RusA-like endonuclease
VSYIKAMINGVPYSQAKSRGDKEAPQRWTGAIVAQTRGLPCVKEACLVKITFLLPPDKFPVDFPYGPDLDNLLKRFMDALNGTVFREAKGNDSCIVSMTVIKTKVASPKEAGAHLEVLPVSLATTSSPAI